MTVFLHNMFSRDNSVNRLQDDLLLGTPTLSLDEERINGDHLLQRKSGLMVEGIIAKNGHSVAIAAGAAIKWKAGIANEVAATFELCGAGESADGWVDPLSSKSVGVGEQCHVITAGPVRKVLAGSETFAVDDLVKTGAAGVVTAAGSRTEDGFCGVVLEATASSGDPVAILGFVSSEAGSAGGTALTQTKTDDYTVLVSESGGTFDTTGATGAVVFTMPPAVEGLKYRFRVGAAQELRIDPDGTETISLPSTGVAGAAGKYLTANAAGETVDIQCVVDGTWSVFGFTGTWTAEA